MSPHRGVLASLAAAQGWKRGAELGVDKGILFHLLLESVPDLTLIGVDVCPDPQKREKCERIAAKFSDRAQLHVMTTREASALVPNYSLDFVFIDADHSEAAVTDDIAHWRKKVKSGGWLGGHDYNAKFPGVMAAVNRMFGRRVQKWPGSIWGVWA